MIDPELWQAAAAVLDACRARGLTVALAESCTGGLVASALTDIAGSSDVVERGFVTYSNVAKQQMLGVPAQIISTFGAVSRQTAEAMATGALKNSAASIAVSITGIAGPGGGSPGKPIGLVHFAAASRAGHLIHAERHFGDIGRGQVRHASVLHALAMLLELALREPLKS